ncbi:hypothetical protein WAF17_00330 [Bernardetia sp. ABR2-2B]|uniref:hypothetical protein n=1 Tax=Bernardetia sp. ABR2-2B TaxID=3127472 RepID=UPI0030D4D318
MQKYLLFFIIFSLFSCKKEEVVQIEELKNPLYEQLVGNYYTSSILIEETIDVNGDGVFSNNILSEFGERLNSSKNRLEIKSNKLLEKELLFINFPSLDPQTFTLDAFITSSILLGSEYLIKDNFLIVENEEIISIELIDLNTLEVKGKMQYLTYEETKQITFTALYEKR